MNEENKTPNELSDAEKQTIMDSRVSMYKFSEEMKTKHIETMQTTYNRGWQDGIHDGIDLVLNLLELSDEQRNKIKILPEQLLR